MTRIKRKRQKEVVVNTDERFDPVGPDRFTVERFFGNVQGDPFLVDMTLTSLRSGYQLSARAVPAAVLPCVLILACYSRVYEDIELVDDYQRLVDDFRIAVAQVGGVSHPDLFMASSICILYQREEVPTYEGFEAIKIPDLFKELVYVEE